MNSMAPIPEKSKFFQRVKQQKDRAALEAAAALPNVLTTPTFTLALRPPRKQGAKGIYYMMRNGLYYRSLKVYEDQPEEAEARYELAVQQELAKLHGIVSDRDISLETVFDTFIYNPPPKGAPQSDHKYFGDVCDILKRLRRYFPGKNLGDINRTTVTQYRNMNIPKVRGKGFVCDRTLRNDIYHLQRVCNLFAFDAGLTTRIQIPLGRMPDADRTYLERDQLARFFMACRGYIWDEEANDYAREPVPKGSDADPGSMPFIRRGRDVIRRREPIRRLALIMWKTGTRLDATLSLSWKRSRHFGYIDLEGRNIFRLGYGVERAGGKNQATSAMPRDLVIHLQAWKRKDDARGADFLIHKPSGPPDRYTGLPVAAWTEVLADAGIPMQMGTHELCHTCITHLLMAGYSPVLVGQWTGRSPITIIKNYLHHDLEGQHRAMNDGRRRGARFNLDDDLEARPTRRRRMYENTYRRDLPGRARKLMKKRNRQRV